MRIVKVALFWFLFQISIIYSQKNPHFLSGRSTIVHLFEWKWIDIEKECQTFLNKFGFGGIQISPVNENLIVTIKNNNRPWWERYQAISYKLINRSGNQKQFANMVETCNKQGIRIYVDVILNHMTGSAGEGTGGGKGFNENGSYPNVPYSDENFHRPCSLNVWDNITIIRNCELVHLRDLNQSNEYVRDKQIEFLNSLIDFGVAGFRLDAAKHMWPKDLEMILTKLKYLNTSHGFPPNSKAFIYQEVADFGTGPIRASEYESLGRITEFKHSFEISNMFNGNNLLKYAINWGTGWAFMPSEDALNFVDNHDIQRNQDNNILTYKVAKKYKMAIAFMLAHPYGCPRIMSSFNFIDFDQGPPQNVNGDILSPEIRDDKTCTNGWICEHRWRQIYNMVGFRNVVNNTNIENWWSDDRQQIAFSRGDKGFIAFTNEGDINKIIQTSLPQGIYCDIISGDIVNGICNGKTIVVGSDGKAFIPLNYNDYDGVLAIHVNARLI